MRKTIAAVIEAFINKAALTCGNTTSSGTHLFLQQTVIARWHPDGQLGITTAGWPNNLAIQRLNKLPGVHITLEEQKLRLNGTPWDGSWTLV